MLPKNHRLHLEKDILRVLRVGHRRRDENLQLIYIPSPLPKSRACVIVSKKVAKKAHDRNKVRRQVQALLPKYLKLAQKSLDVIVRVNSTANFKQKNFDTSLKHLWLNYDQPRPTHRH